MASGHVNIPPHLMPWQQHGVDYILAKDELPQGLSICHAIQKEPPRRAASPKQTSLRQTAPPRQMPAQAPPPVEQTPRPTQNTHTHFVPMAQWPTPWQELMAKTAHAPVVWTYWSLGDDLSGNAKAERRDFLRKILSELGHPRGTNTFWPVALPDHNRSELIANPQAFWSGAQMLKARAVVAMGQAATKVLGLPNNLRPFMQTRHNGCFVVVLRDVDFLIEEPHLYGNVREFLRSSLAPFANYASANTIKP